MNNDKIRSILELENRIKTLEENTNIGGGQF